MQAIPLRQTTRRGGEQENQRQRINRKTENNRHTNGWIQAMQILLVPEVWFLSDETEQTKICARHFVEFWKPSPNSGFCTNHQRLHQSLHAPTKSCRQMHLVRHPTSISAQANVASSSLALVATHSPFSPSCLRERERESLSFSSNEERFRSLERTRESFETLCALLSSVVHLTEIDYPGVLWRLTVTGNSQGLKSAVCEVRKGGFQPSYASESSYRIGLMWSVRCCRLPIRGPDCKEVIFAVGSDLQLLSTLRNLYQNVGRIYCAWYVHTTPTLHPARDEVACG